MSGLEEAQGKPQYNDPTSSFLLYLLINSKISDCMEKFPIWLPHLYCKNSNNL